MGILDSPWGKPALRQRLGDARETLGRRLRGQDEAVERSLDIVVRSVMGLSGAQASEQPSKPRGVLFFAGPTGVGKTELAKALTELIFGDERAYIRFDMSEFAAEHAAERLTGAPPGYLGHDAGGELTNAVRKQPFSLILFDEIEKAHPRVMDKFLQILDDGRLTDGSGSTVYFSEAVIVFTSNLGLKVMNDRGIVEQNVTADMPRTELEERMTSAVREHFIDDARPARAAQPDRGQHRGLQFHLGRGRERDLRHSAQPDSRHGAAAAGHQAHLSCAARDTLRAGATRQRYSSLVAAESDRC